MHRERYGVPVWCCVREQSVRRYCGWNGLCPHVAQCYWVLTSDPRARGHVDAVSVPSSHILASSLVAVSVPKKKRRMKDLNKKEAVGDLLEAFKEVSVPRHLRISLCPLPSCDEFYFVPSCLGH